MATQVDINKGAQALYNFVMAADGFEANFIPWGVYDNGAVLILNTWDKLPPATNTDAVALKKMQCSLALFHAIVNAGYGNRVTPDQCAAAALAVLSETRNLGVQPS